MKQHSHKGRNVEIIERIVEIGGDTERHKRDYVGPRIVNGRVEIARGVGEGFKGKSSTGFQHPWLTTETVYANEGLAAFYTISVTKREIRAFWRFVKVDTYGTLYIVTWRGLSDAERKTIALAWLVCSQQRRLAAPHKEIETFI